MAADSVKPLVVNIYLIYSPLHYLAAESIAANFEKGARNYLFYLKQEYQDLVDPAAWDGVRFLPWPRFYPEKGMLGGVKRARNNLRLVGEICTGAAEIRLHTTVIDSEAVNYLINYLRSNFPAARFSIRIIPDGLLNIRRRPLKGVKPALQYLKKFRRLIAPELNYYTFSGDRTGADDPLVDRIYLMPRLPHEYDAAKVVELPSLVSCTGAHEAARPPRALVVGQPLLDFKRMTPEHLATVTQGIRDFIAGAGIAEVVFKAHPKDKERGLAAPGYSDLELDEPLEMHLAHTPYDLVIGVFSTALVTARQILPESSRVVAYGINLVNYRYPAERGEVEDCFKSCGVEMIDA